MSVANAELVARIVDYHVVAEEKVARPALDESSPRAGGTGAVVIVFVRLVRVVRACVVVVVRVVFLTALRVNRSPCVRAEEHVARVHERIRLPPRDVGGEHTRVLEHIIHVGHSAHVPSGNITVEARAALEHAGHRLRGARVPPAQVAARELTCAGTL